MIGDRFGKWIVIEEAPPKVYAKRKNKRVKCRCSCGNKAIVMVSNLKSGKTRQCNNCAIAARTGRKTKPRTDITNQRFGQLIAKEALLTDKKGYRKWRCQCDCGNFTEVILSNLTRKHGGTKSCGKHTTGSNHPAWSGYESIPGSYWSSIQRNAQVRNKNFKISIQEAWSLFKKQNGKCVLSGMELTFTVGSDKGSASLDRMDSTQGYTYENCQWVHKVLNLMKGTHSMQEFVAWCNLVTNKQKE